MVTLQDQARTSDAPSPGRTILQMSGIVKEFPGVRALDGVALDVREGEVHCLLGQNGAGKSTLIKVLAAVHQPEAGTITWLDEPVDFPTPLAALNAGLATMYQELDLVDGLTVADNVFLGHETARFGLVDTRQANRCTRELLARLGHDEISPRARVADLSAAGKQVVSMARALSRDARLIVMDEPSAVLDGDEVDNLFRVIEELTDDGVAIIYISHRLEEIRRIGDRVTILKDGATVATGLDAASTPTSELVSLMTGRSVEYVFPASRIDDAHLGDDVLVVDGLTREGEFRDVSLRVRAGEVVGLAGLVGSGRSEVLETVYGARRPDAGTITFNGRSMAGSVPRSVAAGMGLAPEERKSQALVAGQSIARNISLSSLRDHARAGLIGPLAEVPDALAVMERLQLRPAQPLRPVETLSGGNQQKAVLGRWLLSDTRLLLLDEPTRGVDVGARAELYGVVRQLADAGVAVLMVSSEVPEVLGLADNVLVLAEGDVVHRAPAEELTEEAVLDLVIKGSPDHE